MRSCTESCDGAIWWVKLTLPTAQCPYCCCSQILHPTAACCQGAIAAPPFSFWVWSVQNNNHKSQIYKRRKYHWLCGSGSTVLTATGFVNGNNWFSTPTNSTSLNRSPKNCHRWLCRRQLPETKFGADPLTRGFWAKAWKITIFYLIIPSFLGTHLQVTPVGEFSPFMAQTTPTRARICAFLMFHLYCYPFKGSNSLKTRFWGTNRRFQAKRVKNSNFHIF